MRRRLSLHLPVLLKAWLSIMMIYVFSVWITFSSFMKDNEFHSSSSFDSPAAVLLLERSRNTRNAAEIQSERFTPSDSIPVFYNVYTSDLDATTIQTSKSIVDEQMDQMKSFHRVYVRFVGTIFAINNTKTIQYDKEGDEFGTLELLHNYCKENPTNTVVYLHNKGSFHPKPENDALRRFLTRGTLSQECANMPDTCNVCSSRMSPLPHPHTSGNMWVAKCDYIAKLQNPFKFQEQMDLLYPDPIPRESCAGSGRYASEHWVHSHPSIMPCDLSNDKRFTWGYSNIPEAEFDIDLRPAPRFNYEIYEKIHTCPSHTLQHRLKEYQLLYKENPSSSWWGWKFYENTTEVEGSFLANAEFFDKFYWKDLPSGIKRAATMIGFKPRMWDEGREWPQVFGKVWKDISDHESNLLKYLGYSEANWKVKQSLPHVAHERIDFKPPTLQEVLDGENIWDEDKPKTQPKQVDIIVTYCHSGAFLEYVDVLESNFPNRIDSVHLLIISKCKQEQHLQNHLKKKLFNLSRWKFSIYPFINKGGCDISVTWYIKDHLKRYPTVDSGSDKIAIFLKDGPRIAENHHSPGEYRLLSEMFDIASKGRFICGSKPPSSGSVYHEVDSLNTFILDHYRRFNSDASSEISGDVFTLGYKNLGTFLEKSLAWSWPNSKYAEVCYGGTFAFHLSNLYRNEFLSKDTSTVFDLLSTGNDPSIVEHFMERLWAAMISRPLNNTMTSSIATLKYRTNHCPVCGQLILDRRMDINDLFWESLPSTIKDAAVTIGFNEQLWDMNHWPSVGRKLWEDMTKEEINALQILGYSKKNWKAIHYGSKLQPEKLTPTRCSLNFFGLPRSFKSMALPSIVQNILKPNSMYHCDIVVHYYKIDFEDSGRFNNGGKIDTDAFSDFVKIVSKIAEEAGQSTPSVIIVGETKEEFLTKYGEKVKHFQTAIDPDTGELKYFPWANPTYKSLKQIENIVMQWNSIQTAWQLMEDHAVTTGSEYQRVAFFRSDAFYATPIDIFKVDKDTYDYRNQYAVIPGFARFPVNDRMMYGPTEAVRIWATQRFERLDHHISTYEFKGFGMHSERYMEHEILPAIQNETGHEVIENVDICFYRTRAADSVLISDCSHPTGGTVRGIEDIDQVALVERIIQLKCIQNSMSNKFEELRCSNTTASI